MEYDGGMSREQAEAMAVVIVESDYGNG